jgi:hypothetical protein
MEVDASSPDSRVFEIACRVVYFYHRGNVRLKHFFHHDDVGMGIKQSLLQLAMLFVHYYDAAQEISIELTLEYNGINIIRALGIYYP